MSISSHDIQDEAGKGGSQRQPDGDRDAEESSGDFSVFRFDAARRLREADRGHVTVGQAEEERQHDREDVVAENDGEDASS